MVAKVKVEGVQEAVHAFDKVESEVKDLSEVHRAAAEALLPDISDKTRRESGTLASAWQADSIATEARFINEVPYAGVQEYGWSEHNIDPTYAINQAFESNENRIEAVYSDGIERIAGAAGFNTKS